MTLIGKITSCFSMIYFALIISYIIKIFYNFKVWDLLILIFIIYFLPVCLHKIHSLFFPIKEGDSCIQDKKYCPWWTSHMLQHPFNVLPFLEGFLHLIPGLYSIWLKAWGSKIGRSIYWTPEIRVLDRNLIEVGDNVIFGYLTVLVSHMIVKNDNSLTLTIKRIKIGKNSIIGADSQLGPGAEIKDNTNLKIKSRIFYKGEWVQKK